MKRLRIGEDVFMRLLPRQARQGSTRFGRMGDVVQQRPVWVGLSGLLAFAGGPRGQRAAARGSVCFAVAAIVANLMVKPLADRSRPPASGKGRTGPITSSFPSGHAATGVAFTLGVAQEIPALFLPLAVATSSAHWSLVRNRGHYPSDVLAGGLVGVTVAAGLRNLWHPAGTLDEEADRQEAVTDRDGVKRAPSGPRFPRRARRSSQGVSVIVAGGYPMNGRCEPTATDRRTS